MVTSRSAVVLVAVVLVLVLVLVLVGDFFDDIATNFSSSGVLSNSSASFVEGT